MHMVKFRTTLHCTCCGAYVRKGFGVKCVLNSFQQCLHGIEIQISMSLRKINT